MSWCDIFPHTIYKSKKYNCDAWEKYLIGVGVLDVPLSRQTDPSATSHSWSISIIHKSHGFLSQSLMTFMSVTRSYHDKRLRKGETGDRV